MPNISQYSPSEKFIALHISRSGDGKSAASASYPKPYYQFDIDGRFDGVWAACKPQGFLDPSGISFDRYYTRQGYEPIQKKFIELEQLATRGAFPYKTIEIASMTTLMQALINSSHKAQKGNEVAGLRISGPGDFNFEVTGMKQVLDFLTSLPCNVIVSAHIIDKWGKKNKKEPYAPNEIVGEKICLRDQPGEVLLSCFSNVFRFSRNEVAGVMRYYVEFATDVAKNTFGIPPGEFDVTGKPFYPFLTDLIISIRNGTFKPPESAGLSIFG